ncbi:MAG: FAD-dependent oxidoreductase [Actinomycetia bacterium]|nr:FAD-dependent oxidoreductase [Actinomycetes bacterium]MCP4959987.1 FAD-dependent oxidoreductase [Actinomycetes bacterium]
MKSEAKVVVVGGGIVGVAVLYHLTKLGWRDVVLVERKQLTAGSTWHAAAGFHSLNGSLNMAKLQAYSIGVYDEVAEISGQDVGMHRIGSLTCAATEDWWNFVKVIDELNVTLGIESFLIGPEDVPKYTRTIDPSQLIGAMYDPADGFLDPFGATHAYAKAARIQGAEIYQQTLVTELNLQDDDTWQVVTDKGTIHADHVVNAAGLWAREVAAMAGHTVPLVPYEHHYLVTEPLAALGEQKAESCVTVDLDGGIYVRQEVGGLLLGVYEPDPIPWALDGTPWTYGESALLEPRLDDLAPTLEKAFGRFPLMQTAGIKNVVNGPFTFTPDGNPLVGPVRHLPNYWLACGVMAGFSQSGGVALALAQWMIDGEPEEDAFPIDPERFGNWATPAYTLETSTQFYERRFDVPFPNEAWPAGRPAKTTPIYGLQEQAGAQFAPNAGLEIPMWFARSQDEPRDVPSFFRPNSFDAVAEEVAAASSSAGVIDISAYSKFEITGPRAGAWLDQLLASRLPKPGRSRLAVMLSEKGRIIGDFVLSCLPKSPGQPHERFVMTGSGPIQGFHMRWFERFLPAEGVSVENISDSYCGLSVVGPEAERIVGSLAIDAGRVEAMRYFDFAEFDIGLATARVSRVSLTGELGYEIWIPTMDFRSAYDRLMACDPAPRPIGILAMLSMRLEKAFGIWGREFSPDYQPSQNHMADFVHYDKASFVGREAALEDRDQGPASKLVHLTIDAFDADATGFEPVYLEGEPVGYVTSGGYGHRMGLSVAMAYLNVEAIDPAAVYEVPVVGERRAARLQPEPFDPTGSRMRGL